MAAFRLAVAALTMLSVVAGLDVSRRLLAQTAAPPGVENGIYTTAQAERGETLYGEQCITCHGAIRQMMPEVAALLADHTFRARWKGRSLGELFEVIQITMPQNAPGSLSGEQTADLVAFILRGNRRPAGDVRLPDDVETLKQIPFAPAP